LKQRSLSVGLAVAVAAGLLALTWLSVSRGFTGSGTVLHPNPFGPANGTRLIHNVDFTAANEIRQASPQARVLWEGVCEALSANLDRARLSRVESALEELRPQAKGFAPALWAEALLKADSLTLGKPICLDTLKNLLSQLESQKHPFGLYAYGVLAERSGDSGAARLAFQKAVDLAPDFAYAWSRLGQLDLSQNDFNGARQALQLAIGLMESDSTHYRNHSGSNTTQQRDLPRVEAAPYGALAQVFLAQGKLDTATQAIAYGEDRGWHDAPLALARAWWWEIKGDLTKARILYDSIAMALPGLAHVSHLRATLGLKGSSDTKGQQALFAIQILDPLVRAHPKNAPLRLALAKAYAERGLFGLTVLHLDSALAVDNNLPNAKSLREESFTRWLAQDPQAVNKPKTKTLDPAMELEGRDRVLIPGTIGLLGTYNVAWGSSAYQVMAAYPEKHFVKTAAGNWLDRFVYDGLVHENLLAFHHDSLWGILALATDTADSHIDVFGRMIRIKTKISGEGRGTGEASCTGYRTLQGAIWENDDTFEFMAQFQGKENQIRLVRIAHFALPADRRLCELVRYLDRDTWDKATK
jgi:tetratricopeptide (TPR) repeat protein